MAYLYLGHLHGTGRRSTEIIGNQYSSRATAGGQMLCPTMLKTLWRQLNPMPHACLGLSPHPSCEPWPSLPFSSSCSPTWPGLSSPSTWQRARFGWQSSDNSHKVSASSTANSVSVSCNHWICLCMRVRGAVPLLVSKIQHEQNIFKLCNPPGTDICPTASSNTPPPPPPPFSAWFKVH